MDPTIRQTVFDTWNPTLTDEDMVWHGNKAGCFSMLLHCPDVQAAIQRFSDGDIEVGPVLQELDKALIVARDSLQKLFDRFCGPDRIKH